MTEPVKSKTTSFKVYRFKIDRIRMALWKLRLGAKGQRALSELLTSDELPFDVQAIQYERAYRIRKKALKGTSKENFDEIVAERNFRLGEVSRFITILVRPFPSVEDVMQAYESFSDSIAKRHAHMNDVVIVESQRKLPRVSHSRLIETEGENSAGKFWTLSIATIVDKKILIVEFRFPRYYDSPMDECEDVVLLQIEKLKVANSIK